MVVYTLPGLDKSHGSQPPLEGRVRVLSRVPPTGLSFCPNKTVRSPYLLFLHRGGSVVRRDETSGTGVGSSWLHFLSP